MSSGCWRSGVLDTNRDVSICERIAEPNSTIRIDEYGSANDLESNT